MCTQLYSCCLQQTPPNIVACKTLLLARLCCLQQLHLIILLHTTNTATATPNIITTHNKYLLLATATPNYCMQQTLNFVACNRHTLST